MDETREIYPNAPLRFVAFELRYPLAPAFATQDGVLPLYEALRSRFPIIGPPPQPTIEIGVGAVGQMHSLANVPVRLMDRRRTLSAVIGPNAITVETTAYEHYEQFIDVVAEVLRAADDAAPIAGMQRIGLRYIDEIRVPQVAATEDWNGYINPALLAAVELHSDYSVGTMQGIAEYRVSEREATNLRFGALTGRVVEPSGPLRVEPVDDGPFFLIDLDSFWTAPDDELPAFSPDGVLDICTSLRRPIRALFESAITDKLRNEVLRTEKTNERKEVDEQHSVTV
jgi:uncharacterized protein (TIGR04255 family)